MYLLKSRRNHTCNNTDFFTSWYPGSGESIPNLFNFTSETLSDYKASNFDNILKNFQKTEHLNEKDLLENFLKNYQNLRLYNQIMFLK